jgi:hypothetical protein
LWIPNALFLVVPNLTWSKHRTFCQYLANNLVYQLNLIHVLKVILLLKLKPIIVWGNPPPLLQARVVGVCTIGWGLACRPACSWSEIRGP